MARKAEKDKRQFDGPVKIGVPERVSSDTWGYQTDGPNGSTYRTVKVPEPEPAGPRKPKPAEQRDAERSYGETGEGELRNLRVWLVKLGPSSPNASGVLAELWRIETALSRIAGRVPRASYAKTTMQEARPDASAADIAAALDAPYADPTRRSAGIAFGMTAEIWENIGTPHYIWPIDRDDDFIVAATKETKRIKKNKRNRSYYDNKVKPLRSLRKKTQAELAAELGVPLRTYERQLKADRERVGGKFSDASTVRGILSNPEKRRVRTKSAKPAGAAPAAPPEPEQASNDRGERRAPVGSTDDTAERSGVTFGKAERGSPSAGQHSAGTDPNPPLLLQRCKSAAGINPQEDIETMTAKPADTTEARFPNAEEPTQPIEPAPCAPVRSRRDWLVAIQKLNRALVEPDLDDADRIVLEEERAELVAAYRAEFPAPEQAAQPRSAPGRTNGAADKSGRPDAAAAGPSRVVYSGHNRRARALQIERGKSQS